MTKFWNLTNTGTEARLDIIGSIGDPKTWTGWDGETNDAGGAGTLRDFHNEIKALGKPSLLTVSISSEGGIAADGLAIHNMLASMEGTRIVAQINGFCWSAATIVAMAADEVRMAANGSFMIHDVEAGYVSGDVAALQEHIKAMESLNRAIATAYAHKAGGTVEEWMARMVNTEWMTGEEAKAAGLVDTITDPVTITALASAKDFAARNKAPEKISSLLESEDNDNDDMTAEEITKLVNNATAKAVADAQAAADAAIASARAQIEADAKAASESAEVKIKELTNSLAELRKLRDAGVNPGGAAPVPGAKPADEQPTMTRKDFNNLAHSARNAFMASGGKLAE